MSQSPNPNEQPGAEVALHPIQLQFIAVRELYIRTYRALPPDFAISPDEVQLESMSGGYDAARKTLQIDVRARYGDEQELSEAEEEALAAAGKLLVRMRVRIVGQYAVDEQGFPVDMLPEWIRKGGAMTLFPYLREQVYSLTAKCGIRPLILPIMQMPTIKISPPAAEPAPALAVASN